MMLAGETIEKMRMRRMKNGLAAYNYCVSFIDLLGQRQALQGQALLPVTESVEQRAEFSRTVIDTVGAIYRLQDSADQMIRAVLTTRKKSPFRAELPQELRAEWDEMQHTRVTEQRWSDGLVHFASLNEGEMRCPINAIFSIFGTVGSLCFLGLAQSCPVRGAVDIAWGIELHKGELYGAAIARAYELESEYAQYPRIVIGPRVVEYLHTQRMNPKEDRFSKFSKSLANVCLSMVDRDADGLPFLHYLGSGFRTYISRGIHRELYSSALSYITAQAEHFREVGDTKLAFRYSYLEGYYRAHSPFES